MYNWGNKIQNMEQILSVNQKIMGGEHYPLPFSFEMIGSNPVIQNGLSDQTSLPISEKLIPDMEMFKIGSIIT